MPKYQKTEKRIFRGLSRSEAAEYIGVSPTSFDRMIAQNQMPPAKIWRSRRIWDIKDLDRAFEDLPYEKNGGMSTGWEAFCDGEGTASVCS